MTNLRALLAVTATAGLLATTAAVGASADTAWADADVAAIRPGVMTYTEGAQCTANFVFTNTVGDVFLGQAAHCSGTGESTDTNGCDAGSLPLGTLVDVGGSHDGVMVYNSWLAMQAADETDPDACAYNDFALVQIHADDVALVNPSIPFHGGPVGLNTDGVPFGASVYTYGNSSLRFGLSLLSPKVGTSLGTSGNGWTHPVYTASPGIPGDSGSAFLDADGNALGVLSTLALAPLAGSNNVSDLSRALAYAAAHGFEVTLVAGTEPFAPIV